MDTTLYKKGVIMLTMGSQAVTDSFSWVDAIISERERLGWSQADLARAASTTRATISQIELRKRTSPDVMTLSKISRALGHPADWLARIAGILPPNPEADETLEQIDHIYSTLRSIQSKEQALEYMRFLQLQEERAEYDHHKNRGSKAIKKE